MSAERDLTAAEDTLARLLADAILDDIVSAARGLWIAVRVRDESDLQELAERLRAEGREVRSSTAA